MWRLATLALYPAPPMITQPQTEPQTLSQLPFKLLEEVLRQLRSTRNDIIRYAVWNIRNLTDDEFNHTDDRKLFGYFRQERTASRHRRTATARAQSRQS